MYISSMEINNFRSFNQATIEFEDGLNVLIGHNNTGKTNLLNALSLIFDRNTSKHLTVNDFNKFIELKDLKESSPEITITVTLTQTKDEDLLGDDLATVSTWLTSLKKPYVAQIQYHFFLPEAETAKYKLALQDVESLSEGWDVIERDFINKYVNKTYVGDPKNQSSVDLEDINRFDFQFLDAIRDVERDMYSGKHTLLKRIIDFFLDYDVKINKDLTDEDRKEKLHQRRINFKENSDAIITIIQDRLKKGKEELLGYTHDTGATFDDFEPDLQGKLTEQDIFSILELIIVNEIGMSLPVVNNGLGYNNLIYIALLLSKMQVDSDGEYMGSNAKVFPMLVVEEPEAHLHPTMQNHFIRFLNKNLNDRKVRQAFVTTHSTHISSNVNLDKIRVFYKENNETKISYPGRALDDKSKKYVQRFLDATKSNMLFAEKIIFVEGMAEQLLMPVFANYMGKSLEENHVALINVGGRYFEHFLKLFDSSNKYTIKRKISYVTDIDPMRKENKKSEQYKRCYPYEILKEKGNYDYKFNQTCEDNLHRENDSIKCFTQDNRSKTFEYQLALDNPSSLIITDTISNKDELENLIKGIEDEQNFNDFLDKLNKSKENDRIKDSIKKSDWDNDSKRKAVFASRYLNSIEKGEHALDLAVELKEVLNENNTETIIIPKYIKDAINWVCE